MTFFNKINALNVTYTSGLALKCLPNAWCKCDVNEADPSLSWSGKPQSWQNSIQIHLFSRQPARHLHNHNWTQIQWFWEHCGRAIMSCWVSVALMSFQTLKVWTHWTSRNACFCRFLLQNIFFYRSEWHERE